MRTVLKKILTAMRGGVNELGEAVVDGQGNRILEQELRDSEHELKQAKQELASLMAEAASLARQIRTEQDSAAEEDRPAPSGTCPSTRTSAPSASGPTCSPRTAATPAT